MNTDILDPLLFVETFWPDIRLYDKQAEILYSLRDNLETFVPAGNGLGKDFIAGLGTLWFFCSRRPARVVTTSVKHDQLNDVLWGEIRQFIQTARYNLPIQYNHMYIRQVRDDGTFVPKAELVGQVVNKGESLLGRHLPRDIPRTLVVFDEASGIDTAVYDSCDTWAHRKLIIGNPYPCVNFFKEGVKGGDQEGIGSPLYKLRRKVIRIKAEDSPNVRLALEERGQGIPLSNTCLVPGLVDYPLYLERRKFWDAMRQCIGLDAEFYEGASVMLCPATWLNWSETCARALEGRPRKGKAIGIDTAQGGDDTSMAVVDELGLIELRSEKTPNTAKITGTAIAFMREFNVRPESVFFDAGGGGKEHADRLREQGYNVKTIAFGESASDINLAKRMKTRKERTEEKEERYVYFNRRAEMYGLLRLMLDPEDEENPVPVFAIPARFKELRRQLAPIPLDYDSEGRLILPPKQKKNKDDKRTTMTDLIGRSPDDADALVLALFGMLHVKARPTVGAF